MRTSEEYDELLAGFRALCVQVGRRPFDLRWHCLSGIPHSCYPHKDGGWADIEWKGVPVENWPFDPAKREVVGLLCLPMDDEERRFTLGFDVVTIPRGDGAAEPLTDGEGTVGDGFRKLSARAGVALPHQWREWLFRYRSVFDDKAPANWWYALLFAVCGDPLAKDGDSGDGREIDLCDPLSCSSELIERLGLNTDRPKLPEDVWAIDKSSSAPADKPDEGKEERGETQPAIGFLGGEDLANALSINPSRRAAFFKQLERKRISLGDDCWDEVREPRPNSARFIYRVDSVELRDLAAAYKTPKPA